VRDCLTRNEAKWTMISAARRSNAASFNSVPALRALRRSSCPRHVGGHPIAPTANATLGQATQPSSRRVVSSLALRVVVGRGDARGGGAIAIGCIAGLGYIVAGAAEWHVGPSHAPASMEALATKRTTNGMDDETRGYLDEVMEFLGLRKTSGPDDGVVNGEDADEGEVGGPGKRVVVPLDQETIDSLPFLPLSVVRSPDGEYKGRLLVSHGEIVYDVTEFADNHPGGKDLLMTSVGLDLGHFFDNYTVHGNTDKAAKWLAGMAVGRLTEEDAILARHGTDSVVHVERRHVWLGKARRRVVFVAATLPMWMTVRSCVRFVGWLVPSLGRMLARLVPVVVPGLSRGAEPLLVTNDDADGNASGTISENAPTVAVIGGGIAGCGTAWSLRRSGYRVTLFEARNEISGNARTFDWDFGDGKTVKSCCSVTAWPPLFYKNYTCLLNELGVETVHQPLSWFLNSKVPGAVGTLWAADPKPYDGSLRNVLKRDFEVYEKVVRLSDKVCNLFTFRWAPWRRNDTPSMYDAHTNLGLLNPLNVVPLYSLFRLMGGSELWWQVVFTPHYTASFLVDELRPFPAVFGPLIEAQIPLLPNDENTRSFASSRSDKDCNITTCQTWKDAGKGIREVFRMLTEDLDLRENTRILNVEVLPNGKKRIRDEYDNVMDVDRVVFACPANAVGNIHKHAGWLANTIFSTLVYADDHHPDSGHMHAVIHSDGSVIDERYRDDCLKRASNIVEITEKSDGTINIENQYNFGVQTPGPGVYDLPLDKKPVMLISHALGEGKSIDEKLVVGTANHARAHPLYSGWNVIAMLSLRLVQGRDGIYYCSNWTTPGNCHDMSFLSGLVCAHAIGAKYPFDADGEAKKDFHRLRDLMGI
jgi:predicted NAD/FAD-binding protein